ncbi:ABC transporter permease [Acidipila sp. EB88]|uniref:ABC transporter permease n=1 Tax=Acidipila sp. EB88 TaxID=2305226 RepID=UPI000F5DE1D7|nr:ABC transporter permease [Acidipila sp. EB88]RRA47301.1 multidrug ABC transporter permease [Acidipila sp. EB88]
MATTLPEIGTTRATGRAATTVQRPSTALAAYSLWRREIVRFYRQKARVVGVIASPLLFWLVLGSGFANSFHTAGSGSSNGHYLGYFFPGSIVMIVLFTSIFSMMSLIQDRNEGFLLSVLAAPVSRSAIVLGKVLGGATLAAIQGIIFLVFAPLVGVHAGVGAILLGMLVIAMLAFELTALGFTIAWPMDSSQAFHAIVNLLLLPLWMLSGSLFPASGASPWMHALMRANPLAYGVDALRNLLFPAQPTDEPLAVNLLVTGGFCVLCFAAAWLVVNRRTHKPAA